MPFRFQKRISLLPGVRINLSKGGVSTSLGPRGADVNIGKDGVTANASIPGTGLSYRQKLVGGATKKKGSLLGILAVVGGLGLWAFQHQDKIAKAVAPAPVPAAMAPTQSVSAPPAATPQTSSIRYVHRAGSILREEPKTSGKLLKKESKDVQVMLLSEADGWSKVTDGNITGYMRSSVLGVEPPR